MCTFTSVSFKLQDEIFSHKQRSKSTDLLKDDSNSHHRKIDDLSLRGSYKTKIYSLYETSMIRFSLMVQELSTNGVKELDKIASKFIWKWTKVPNSTTSGHFCHKKWPEHTAPIRHVRSRSSGD